MTGNPLSPMNSNPNPGMGPTPPPGRFRPIDPMRVIRQHMVLLIVTAIIGVGIGSGLFLFLQKTSPRYVSHAQFEVHGTLPGANDGLPDEMDAARSEQLARYMQNQINRLKSEEILRKAIERPGLRGTRFFQSMGSDARKAHQALREELLVVRPIRGTSLIELRVTAGHREDPRPILDDIMSVYLDQLQIRTNQEIQGLRVVFRRKRDRALEDISRLEEQIAEFTLGEGIVTTTGGGLRDDVDIEYENYARLVSMLMIEVEAAKASYASLESQLQDSGSAPSLVDAATIEQHPDVAERDRQLRRLEEELTLLRGRFPENHRAVQNVVREQDSLRAVRDKAYREIAAEMSDGRLSGASQQIEALEGRLAQAQTALRNVEARKLDMNNRLTRLDQLQEALARAKEDMRMAEDRLDEFAIIETRPDAVPVKLQAPPTEPRQVFPKVTVVVPGVTMALLGFVTALVFLKELLDQRLKSPSDVNTLTTTELLGVLPHAKEDPSGKFVMNNVVERHPGGLLAESFRQVRTSILSRMDRRGYKTLVLVGAQPDCGTSTVLHNLATSLAQNDRKVLIIDANFRRPKQDQLMGVNQQAGLTEVLAGKAQVDQVISYGKDLLLDLLPAGNDRQAPPELIESSTFRSMLSQLESEYDMILIDTTPALLTSEAQLLAKYVDAIAVVIRAKRDHRGMVGRMLRQLDGHRADVIGAILNGVVSSAGGYFRRSYQDYYKYHVSETPKPSKKKSSDRASRDALHTNGSSNGSAHNGLHDRSSGDLVGFGDEAGISNSDEDDKLS